MVMVVFDCFFFFFFFCFSHNYDIILFCFVTQWKFTFLHNSVNWDCEYSTHHEVFIESLKSWPLFVRFCNKTCLPVASSNAHLQLSSQKYPPWLWWLQTEEQVLASSRGPFFGCEWMNDRSRTENTFLCKLFWFFFFFFEWRNTWNKSSLEFDQPLFLEAIHWKLLNLHAVWSI